MAVGEMVAEARIGLLSLFSQENNDLWYVCYPTSDSKTAIDKPPSTSAYHLEEFLALIPAEKCLITNGKEQLQRALDTLFAGDGSLAPVLHNDSFWWRLISALQFELGEGLVVHPQINQSEADISIATTFAAAHRPQCADTRCSGQALRLHEHYILHFGR